MQATAVYSCVRILAEAVASLPVHLYRYAGKGKEREYFVKLNVDGLLRGDYQSRMTGYSVGRQNGWLSTNDIREMEDMNPIPAEEGGDLYLVCDASGMELELYEVRKGFRLYCVVRKPV